ncbi:MAG: two-component sensor histidine kinase [Firmicutes bacterium HGW-Firmicutes-1]|jgi:signal transduction histidine kinase|nr:MAG: two-component sensor histidine kinase [Firmicutes bacterium HGW-Firmicutes-1]
MKNSIFLKLFFYMIANILLFTILLYISNLVFANQYYINHKKTSLIENSQKVNELLENIEGPFDRETIMTINRLERNIGASITIGQIDGNIYYPTPDNLPQRMLNGNNNPFFIFDEAPTRSQLTLHGGRRADKIVVIKDWEQYDDNSIFVGVEDPSLLIDTLRFQTILDNGLTLLIWVPMAEISESISVSNSFTAIIGLITLFITGIWSLIISKKFTRPITDMNRIAKKMLDLNFSKILDVKGNDEIAELSHTINKLSEKLNDTINELNAKNLQLEADIDKERKLDNMRKEFISNVSHELKTPIFLIQGYAEGLKANIASDEEKKNFYSDVIVEEADKMDFIVKDLLDLTQMESGTFSVSKCTFDIGSFTKDIMRKMEPLILSNEIHLELEIDEPIMINADPDRIEQVLVNYMTNAIHHVDDQHKIKIKFQKTSNKARISVFNTGIPIPAESLDKIWSSFYKVDHARTRSYGGSGLGLSIVKNIMNAHNNRYGAINVTNGVEFWFEIDLV